MQCTPHCCSAPHIAVLPTASGEFHTPEALSPQKYSLERKGRAPALQSMPNQGKAPKADARRDAGGTRRDAVPPSVGRVPAHPQLVLLPVDDDGCDLLVHEDEDGDQEGGQGARQVNPPRVLPEGKDEPPSVHAGGLGEKRGGLNTAAEPGHGSERGKNPSADVSGSPTSPPNLRASSYPVSIPECHHHTSVPKSLPASTCLNPQIFPDAHQDSPHHQQQYPGWGEEKFLAILPERDFIAFFLP